MTATTLLEKNMSEFEHHVEVIVKERETDIDLPPKYKVVMHNDDFTAMDFVVDILVRIFGHSEEKAIDIMYDVHRKGTGIAGVYTKDIAETKAHVAMQMAQSQQFPFLLTVEPE